MDTKSSVKVCCFRKSYVTYTSSGLQCTQTHTYIHVHIYVSIHGNTTNIVHNYTCVCVTILLIMRQQ